MNNAVYILIDRSQSMENLWDEAIGSVNGYVEKLPAETDIFVACFDSLSYDVLRKTTAGEFTLLSRKDAEPRGGTPLFDASARMMLRVLDDKPERAVFVVMTDGDENNSQNFRQSHVKSLVKNLEEKKYEVVFLGANFDKVGDVATSYGLNARTKSWSMSPGTMRGTMDAFATASMNYMNTGAAINTEDLSKTKTNK